MPLVLANRVQETGTANTTVSFTLTGAVTGFQSFAVIGNTNTTYYSATDGSGNWEVGLGTYSTTGPTLTRTTVYASSNSNLAVTFSGAVNVFVTYPSGQSVNLDASGNVSALGTITSGTWQGTTVGVAYGGTGVTASTGPNSVVLRDANENITVNRINQGLQTTTATGGTTSLTAASDFNQALVGTGGHTFRLPDATTLSDTTTFQFNNNATGMLTIENNAGTAVGTVASGGAAGIALLSNATVGGTWDVHAYIPENVTWGTNSLALGSTVISGGTWQGGTITPAYGGTGLTTFVGANNALYSTGASTLTAGTLPVAAGGTGLTTYTLNGVVYASGTGTLATGSALTFDGTTLTVTGGASIDNASGAGFFVRNTTASTSGSSLISFQNRDGAGAFRTVARASGVTTSNGGNGDFLVETAYSGVLYKGLLVDSLSDVYFYNSSGAKDLRWDSVNQRLGVNNIAPTANLDVTGTANVSGALSAGSLAGSIATGSGASGTWSINISGNAATATTAANVNNGTLTLAVAGTGLSGSATFTANQAGNSTFTVTSNATSANTASTIVARDASGNFSAGTITASLSGNASTATSATTATSTPKVSTYDLRSTALTPDYFGQGLSTAFMANSTDGLSDGGTYHGIIQFQQWSDASGGGAAEIAITDNNNVWHRGSSGALTTWSTWYKFLDSGNYNSYAPTLTGGGASGTWGISISGNAATATSATSATNASNLTGGNISGAMTGTMAAGSQVLELANNDNYLSARVIRNNASTSNRDGMYIGYGNSNSGLTRIYGGGATSGGIEITGSGVNNVTIAGNIAINAGNYNSYAPTLTGGGASGTWGISISGNASTASGLGANASLTTPVITGTREVRVSAGTTFNLATGNYFSRTNSGATSFAVSNVPASGTAASFILDLTNGGSGTVTWWSGVKWPGGTAPTLTAAGRDVLGFFTYDGGTTWTGLVLGKDVK